MNEGFVELISQTGIWCATTFVLGKVLLNYISKTQDANRQLSKERDEITRQDNKEREERLYTLLDRQEVLMGQQKDLLSQQAATALENKETLKKLTEIQMLHTNRLDRIEDRQSQMEAELRKIGDKLNS